MRRTKAISIILESQRNRLYTFSVRLDLGLKKPVPDDILKVWIISHLLSCDDKVLLALLPDHLIFPSRDDESEV